jgi:hypothetical protein
MAQRYYLSIDDLAHARGQTPSLSFQDESPDVFAAALQEALRQPQSWQRWLAMQPDPDAIDDALGAVDPAATVSAHQSDLRADVVVTTTLPHSILRHRLNMLIGAHWTLRDVKSG